MPAGQLRDHREYPIHPWRWPWTFGRKEPLHIHTQVHRARRQWIGLQIVCHAIPAFTVDSKRLIALGADNNLILVKQLFKFAPVARPKCAIKRLRHDLNNHDVIAFDSTAALPKTLGWRTSVLSKLD